MKTVVRKAKKVKTKPGKVPKAKKGGKKTKGRGVLLKPQKTKLEKVSTAKGKTDEATKKLLAQKEAELNRLKEEVEYKNRQLAARDVELQSYKRITDEKIFQLEAKVKEFEAKAGASF